MQAAKSEQDGLISWSLVIGGGVNGAGIARDAAGRRGLRVVLAAKRGAICAQATSSASTSFFHGGLGAIWNFSILRGW